MQSHYEQIGQLKHFFIKKIAIPLNFVILHRNKGVPETAEIIPSEPDTVNTGEGIVFFPLS